MLLWRKYEELIPFFLRVDFGNYLPLYMENTSSNLPSNQEGELFSDSLIIRVWLKDVTENRRGISWYGQITQVSSGETQYIKDLGGIIDFLIQFLDTLGARISWRRRLERWFFKERSMISRNRGSA